MSLENRSKYGLLIGSMLTVGKWSVDFVLTEVVEAYAGLSSEVRENEKVDTGSAASMLALQEPITGEALEGMTLEEVQSWSHAREVRLLTASDSVYALRLEVQRFHDLIQAEKVESQKREAKSHRRRR
jgi:hypothetical protein